MDIHKQLVVLAEAKDMISDVYHANIEDDVLSNYLSCADSCIGEAEYALKQMLDAQKKFEKFVAVTLKD